MAIPNRLARIRALAAPLKNSWEINLGLGLLALHRAWKGVFGERGLGQGTEATVNNPNSTCVAGEIEQPQLCLVTQPVPWSLCR